MCFYSVFSDIGNLIYDIWGVTIDTKQKDGDKMKWHKINKCLPPEGEVVLVHVNDYKYMVGQLSSYGDEQMKFGFLPWNDDGEFLKVNECLTWAKFTEKDRSPFEPKI